MFKNRWALVAALTLIAALALGACSTGAVETVIVEVTTEGGEVVTQIVEVTAVPEEVVHDTIIICMAQEPDSLYGLNSSMAVSTQVRTAMDGKGWYYDLAYGYETQMLADNAFPTFESGDAVIEGEAPDQILSVTYRYKEGITWSDGEPFTVDDILYTREVLIDENSGATSRGILDQMTFEKVDDLTLKVTYPVGVLDPLFYLPPLSSMHALSAPLPEHVLGEMTPAEILESDYVRAPNPVLGPYEFVEWVEGDHITLKAVDGWWGGEIGTPNLIFRFITDTNTLLASTLSGECDYATSDGLQLTQLPFIQQSASRGLIAYEATPSLVWEHLDFNTFPVAEAEGNGEPFFADTRVRHAVAYGLNRQEMVETILYGEVTVLTSYLPSDHWAWNPETEGMYPYDPEQAMALLEEAGWSDTDGDGIREAGDNVSGEYSCGRGPWSVTPGTPFEVTFHSTTGNAMRVALMNVLIANMSEIGIKVNDGLIPASVWFAGDGPLYTRVFQLGEFAWVAGPDPSYLFNYGGINLYRTPDGAFINAEALFADEAHAAAFEAAGIDYATAAFGRPETLPEGYVRSFTEQIPDATDDYEGQNDTGYCNADFVQQSFEGDNLITDADRLPFHLEAQAIWAADLPVLPLFQRVEVEAFSTQLCGPARGPAGSAQIAWNVETWSFVAPGETCPE